MHFLSIVGTISLAWGSLWRAHFLFYFLWSTRGLRGCRCGSGHTCCCTIACCSITRICQFITANITSVMQGKNYLAIHLPGRKSQFECQKEFLNFFVDMPWSSKSRQMHTDAYESPHKEHHPSSIGQRCIVTFSTHDQQQCSYCTSTCSHKTLLKKTWVLRLGSNHADTGGGSKQHMGTKAKPQINKVYAKELTARPTSGISQGKF